jgi:hypothetical protein
MDEVKQCVADRHLSERAATIIGNSMQLMFQYLMGTGATHINIE